MQGTVKFFSEINGYGFIQPNTPGMPDVFVHASTLKGVEINRGDILDFDVVETADGRLRARNVRPI